MRSNSVVESFAKSELMRALSAAQSNGNSPDLVITCNYKQWTVHSAVILERCSSLRDQCTYKRRTSSTTVLDLSEDWEEAVEQMITYFYYSDYPRPRYIQTSSRTDAGLARSESRTKSCKERIDRPRTPQRSSKAPLLPITPPEETRSRRNSKKAQAYAHEVLPLSPPPEVDVQCKLPNTKPHSASAADEPSLLLHARVYALAEKYRISRLKALARQKFEMSMAMHYDGPDFAEAVKEVYCHTVDSDRSLRNVVLRAFINHPRLAVTQDVYAVIKRTPTLATELFKLERGLPIS